MEELYYVILSNCMEMENCEDFSKWKEYSGTWLVEAKTLKRANELRDMNKGCFLYVKIVDRNFKLVI